ncbi:MAG: serine hydrolase [Pseudomonadales bacterium]|jgi:beta-lactamase class C|nr:serine hydrolase [Pseudomonadales bacterium]
MRRSRPLRGAPLLLFLLAASAFARSSVDAEITAFMAEHGIPGMAVGWTTPEGNALHYYGLADPASDRPVTAGTRFELGSISKTFTAALTALAVETGVVDAEKEAANGVPRLQGTPAGALSLEALAAHVNGGLPLQFPDRVADDAAAVAWLAAWRPAENEGPVRSYSNPGMGLLGLATAGAWHERFETLVETRLLGPIALGETGYAADPAHDAVGRRRSGEATVLSPGPLDAPAYGLRSSAGDLLRWVEAQLGRVAIAPELARALAATQHGRFDAGPLVQGWVWERLPWPVSEAQLAAATADRIVLEPNPVTRLPVPDTTTAGVLVHKTGGTGGFGAWVGFVPEAGTGLVLLANANHPTPPRVMLGVRLLAARIADAEARPSTPR